VQKCTDITDGAVIGICCSIHVVKLEFCL